jgi:hypothetical protein
MTPVLHPQQIVGDWRLAVIMIGLWIVAAIIIARRQCRGK